MIYLCSPFQNHEIMYAIVDIAGKQFKVSKDQQIFAPRLTGESGDKLEFDKVLLVDDEGKVKVGNPTIKGAKVSGKIDIYTIGLGQCAAGGLFFRRW